MASSLAAETGRFSQARKQAAEDLLAFEFFPAAVFFDDHVGDFVDAFVGGEALVAALTFAPAADGVGVFAFAGIHNTVLGKSADRDISFVIKF